MLSVVMLSVVSPFYFATSKINWHKLKRISMVCVRKRSIKILKGRCIKILFFGPFETTRIVLIH
jgi:hypothetical protein